MVASVTARHKSLLATWRRMVGRRTMVVVRCGAGTIAHACLIAAVIFGMGTILGPMMSVASAKSAAALLPYNPLPPKKKPAHTNRANDGQMLVQATQIDYDYTNSLVAAVGKVQIYYNGSTLEADRVIYNQKTKRLHATGNVRITEADGKITYADEIDLSDDYRDGFVDSLRIETPDRTRMAATRADRTAGTYTVFQNGVYTACEPCKDNPKKPPLWQVKAARIIHDQGEKMLYFEDARLEFFGTPLAYLPYFSTPDPTVKRKTGFLMPVLGSSSKYGVSVETPFYWALAPDYDLTLSPRLMTKQGILMQADWRQRLMNGSYEIKAAGLFQADQGYFFHNPTTPTPGARQSRGSLETNGQFALNQNWIWGWSGTLLSDKTFFQDYGLSAFANPTQVFQSQPTDVISQLYITGAAHRAFFDARTMYYNGLSEADNQGQIPVIHPVLDYTNVLSRPVLGGQLAYNINLTSLSRDTASYNPITAAANTGGLCTLTSADPTARTPANCLLRGAPGTYSRFSTEANWRRTITDSLGQMWTPFASLRADVAVASINSQPGVTNYLAAGNTEVARVMPTVGLEYRYPFINVQPWGTQTITPIAQVIVRPNEQSAGKLPNEDAQSLTYDDSNLFKVDKFSGWDRQEGGGRANVGIEATTQFNRAGTINVLFGQSYQLFGVNSFAVADPTNTGLATGLETSRSDYVGRISYQPNSTLTFISRARFDDANFTVRRFELEGRANFDRWAVSMLYGNYDAQPLLGFLARREGLLSTASYKLAQNWVISGGARYDLIADKFNQTIIGASYVDDCFVLGMNYIADFNYSSNPHIDHRVMLQIGLRTIGGTSLSQHVGTAATTP